MERELETLMATLAEVPPFLQLSVALALLRATWELRRVDIRPELQAALKLATAQGMAGLQIEALLLGARLAAAGGDTPAALSAMERALTLAAPEGAIRAVLDVGPELPQLLALVGQVSEHLELRPFITGFRCCSVSVGDLTAGLEAPRRTRRLPRLIRANADRQAVEKAIAAAPQPFRLALTILRETGMRAGEVLALTLGDVTLEPGREALLVRDPKNRSERVVVLGPVATPKSLRTLRAQLRERKDEPPHSLLLRSNRGTRLSYDALHYQWTQACASTGLADGD